MVIKNSLIPPELWFERKSYLSRTEEKLFGGKSFYDIIQDILKENGLEGKSNAELIAITHLSSPICSRLKNDWNYRPSIETILAFCVGFHVPEDKTYYLLSLKSYALSRENPVHCAYMDIVHVCDIYGFGVLEFNAILCEWGIDKKHFLGSFGQDEVM